MAEILLSCKNLSITFHGNNLSKKNVDGLSFSLQKGEILGIVGESGSGKTISCMALLQLLNHAEISADELLFHNTDTLSIDLLKANNDEIRNIRGKEIAVIFQNPMTSFNPVFTCGNQLMEAIQIHQKINNKEAKAKALKWLEEVELKNAEEIFEKYPHQLSGGQKQRVMIAMAMCNYPKLLIADEPTTALDVTLQLSLLKLMKRLQRDYNMAMIFISHDLNVVKSIAENILVMKNGMCVEFNSSKNIFESPQHNYTKTLLNCKPTINKKQNYLPQLPDDNTNQIISDEQQISIAEKLQSNECILEIKNVFVSYESHLSKWWKQNYVEVVSNADFKIHKGEVLGLVGESGSGKTSLGKAIVLLNSITKGEILYRKKNIHQFNKNELLNYRKNVQFIFQDAFSSLNPKHTIGETLLETILFHQIVASKNEAKQKAIEWLKKVNLPENYYSKFPHELSGGERQRIVIARALSIEPELIIADEPVSNLDVSIQAQVLNLMKKLQHGIGFSCLFISHDLGVINFMCDAVMIMQNGKIIENGFTPAIIKKPQQAYTQQLIASVL